jgi:hypothetical protein
VAWYKDGIIQRNTSDFKQTFDGLNAKLEIDEIFVDDHGEYACVAKNDFGENKTTCRIKIKENYDNFFSNMKKMNEICFYLLVFQRMISLI